MIGNEVWVTPPCKTERVEEEKAKDDHDTGQDAPPKLLVHHGLDALLSLQKIFHGEVQRIQSPNVESCESSREGKYDQEDQRSGILRSNGQAGDCVDDSEYEVTERQNSDIPHRLAQARLDHAIAHTYNEEEEEGE